MPFKSGFVNSGFGQNISAKPTADSTLVMMVLDYYVIGPLEPMGDSSKGHVTNQTFPAVCVSYFTYNITT